MASRRPAPAHQDWQQRCNAADIQREKYKSDISHHEERLAMQGLSRQEAMERRREGSLKELHDKVASLKADHSPGDHQPGSRRRIQDGSGKAGLLQPPVR